jgi:hypothetical protein
VHEHQDREDPGSRAPGVVLAEKAFGSIDAAEWDDFVLSSGGSFLGSWSVVRAERLIRRVRLFEFVVPAQRGSPLKVGQCAVAMARGEVRFLDRLHLAPAHRGLWDRCIHLVTERCGPAVYRYGSPWNHEGRQPAASLGAAAAGDLSDIPFRVDLIDFGRWADFDAYRRDVSENIRRDYKKAVESSARVEIRYGLAAVRDLPGFIRLRREVMLRNGEPFSPLLDYVRHALKLACIGQLGFIATVKTGGQCHAAFFGVRFGDNFYHLAGGTEKNSQGFGSYLFLTLIEQWFTEHPRGRLYLGIHRGTSVDPKAYTRGNLLYRRKLRAASVEGAQFSVTVAQSAAQLATAHS